MSSIKQPQWRAQKLLLFGVGQFIANFGALICAASLFVNSYALIHSNQATPKGDLRLAVGDVGGWNVMNDTTNSAFGLMAQGSKEWAAQKQKQLPAGWAISGPFDSSYQHVYDYPKKFTEQATAFGVVDVPRKDIHGRWRLWVPTLLREGLYAVGLFLTARMLRIVRHEGPFDARVYKYLRVIALLGFIGSIVYSIVHTTMLNHAYAGLIAPDSTGLFALRFEPNLFNPVWLVALAVVEILRYGSQIQQEHDATV